MSAEWYFSIDGQQRGPVSWDTIQHLVSTGRIAPDDSVWTETRPERVPVDSVIDFPLPPKAKGEGMTYSSHDHSDRGGIDVVGILETNRQMTATDRWHFAFGIFLLIANFAWSLFLIAVTLIFVAVALICFVGGIVLTGIAWIDTPPPFNSRLLATLAGMGTIILSLSLGLIVVLFKKRFLVRSIFSLFDMTPNFSRHPTAAFSGRATQETQDAKPSNAAITSIRCVGAVLITIPVSSLFHSSLMEAMLVGIVVGIFAVLWGVKFNPFTETESPLIHFRAETVGAALAEGIAAGIVVPVVYAVVMGVIAGFRTR